MAYASGWSSIIELQNGQTISDKYDSTFANIDTALLDIDTKLNGVGYESIRFIPQASAPTALLEGMMYYDLPSHSFVAINDIPGTKLNIGHEVIERCSNATGTTIAEGTVVAVGGVDVNNDFEMIRADASILATSVAFGIATSSPLGGDIGLVTKLGRVNGIDTVGVAVNEPLYLSDVTPGTLTGVSPEISTVVGYVVVAQSAPGALDGVIYVDPRSIVSLPNVVAFMNQDAAWVTPVSLDASVIKIVDYDPADAGSRIMDYTASSGEITAPATGIYDVTLDFDSSFDDIGNVLRHALIEVIESDGVAFTTVAQYNKTIGKNSTTVNGSMTKTFNVKKDFHYYLAISCPDGILLNFVLTNVSFSLKSIDIR